VVATAYVATNTTTAVNTAILIICSVFSQTKEEIEILHSKQIAGLTVHRYNSIKTTQQIHSPNEKVGSQLHNAWLD
jgi:hypothetical protein